MKNSFKNLWVFFIGGFLAGCILLSGLNPAEAGTAVGVKIMEKEIVGKYLADGKGITLYSFAKDTENASNCFEGCAVNWPPFHADPAAVIEGCETSDFGTFTRSDGREQTTYKGRPLYYFKNDKYAGDTFGQGLGDAWFLVTP